MSIDNRINLQPPPVDFSITETTGQESDNYPAPGTQARFDWQRSFLLGLLSHQASFSEPQQFRLGSMWFDLNAVNNGAMKFRHNAGPILSPTGDDWVTLAHGIELEPGLSLHQFFEQIRDIAIPPSSPLTAIFHRFTSAIAGEPISAGSLVYPNADSSVRLADNTDPTKIGVLGASTITVGLGGTTVIQHVGLVNLRMASGLSLSAGDKIYLTTSGRGTNVPPVSGELLLVGVVFDASNYVPLDTNPLAAVVIGALATASASTTSGLPFEAGAAITQYFVVYKTSTEDAVEHAAATSISLSNTVVGAADADALAGNSLIVNYTGLITLRAEAGVSIASGDVLYLSTLPGRVTNVAPSASGEVQLVLGYAKSSTVVAGGIFSAFWAPRTPVVNP